MNIKWSNKLPTEPGWYFYVEDTSGLDKKNIYVHYLRVFLDQDGRPRYACKGSFGAPREQKKWMVSQKLDVESLIETMKGLEDE